MMKPRIWFSLLVLVFLALPSFAWSQSTTTTEETEEITPEATQAPAGVADLIPEDASDVFDPSTLCADDPHDIAFDPATKIWTVAFWADPLNNWVGKPPAGQPPYKVFIGGVPEGSCKFDGDMNMPMAAPLLVQEDGVTADPGNVAWILKLKKFGDIRFNMFVISADGKDGAGNIVMSGCTYAGGGQCGYQMSLNKDGTVTTSRCYKKPGV